MNATDILNGDKITELERQLADCQKRLEELQRCNSGQAELIGKFEDAVGKDLCVSEALVGILNLHKRLEEARDLLFRSGLRDDDWFTRRDAFLATFKDKKGAK